jgi:ubiquinone/menaquinone biosynthesis C-methylase UbiE
MAGIDAVRASYDAIAERYADEISEELADKPLDRALYACFAELVGQLAVDGRVVGDVGCGPGHVTRFLAGLGLPMLGVDASPGMIRVAQRRHPALAFEAGAFAKLPAKDASWAGAVAPYSIIHLSVGERRAAYAELARAIMPGGWLLIAFHTSDAAQPPGTVGHVTSWWDTPVDLDFHYLEPDEVSSGLDTAGFAVRSRTEREPWPTTEHQSRRCYLLAQRR